MLTRAWSPQVAEWLPSLAIGPAMAVVFSIPLLLPLASVQGLQLTTADMLFLWEGGPRLGTRPVQSEIVMVRDDEKTYRELSAQPLWGFRFPRYEVLAGQDGDLWGWEPTGAGYQGRGRFLVH